MRRVVYKVQRSNGKYFRTIDYEQAVSSGNRIVHIDYVQVDPETPEQKEAHRARAQKVWEREHGMQRA